MQIQFESLNLSAECVVAIANAVSKDIDSFQETGGLSVTPKDYFSIMTTLWGLFDSLCAAVEQHGLVVSDHVVVPEHDEPLVESDDD